MKVRFLKNGIIALLLVILMGCVPHNKNVVVTSYPVEYLVKTLAGNRVNVERLDTGSVPQRATIREDYVDVLSKADTLFYIRELQPYWDVYASSIQNKRKNLEFIDLAERSVLYDFARFTTLKIEGGQHVVESPYYSLEAMGNVDMYTKDPFLWMDPLAMTSMARTIKDWLVASYPDEKTAFEERYNKLEIELTNLQAEYQKLRNSTGMINFVTLTPSFGNWQRSFNLGIYPLSLSKYGALPTEALLNDVRNRITSDNIGYIALEDGLSADQSELYNKIKVEFDLSEIRLKNVFTLSDKDISSNSDYLTIMYENLETLKSMIR